MSKKPNWRFKRAVEETKEHLQINGDPDADDEDAIESLTDECGQMSDGYCSMAGSEYCDWKCPFRS